MTTMFCQLMEVDLKVVKSLTAYHTTKLKVRSCRKLLVQDIAQSLGLPIWSTPCCRPGRSKDVEVVRALAPGLKLNTFLCIEISMSPEPHSRLLHMPYHTESVERNGLFKEVDNVGWVGDVINKTPLQLLKTATDPFHSWPGPL